ncbi:Sulfotransferase domain [Mactra antiquata]
MATGSKSEDNTAPHTALVRKVYKGIQMFENEIEEIQTMNIRDDDIFVCTFPRSGTTLLQEMVYLIATLDFEKANSEFLDARFPFIDAKDDHFPFTKGLKYINELNSPRMIKSHFHYFLLPEQLRQGKGRIIYSVRNPKDAVTSLSKLFNWLNEFDAKSHNEFIEKFIDETGYACPWTRHVLEYWERRNDGNVLFLRYEDFSENRPAAIRRIAEFLGRKLTDDDVERISEHCSIEQMKNNKMTNFSYITQYKETNEDAPERFINKGKRGRWREVLTEDQSRRIDQMIDEVGKAGVEIVRT